MHRPPTRSARWLLVPLAGFAVVSLLAGFLARRRGRQGRRVLRPLLQRHDPPEGLARERRRRRSLSRSSSRQPGSSASSLEPAVRGFRGVHRWTGRLAFLLRLPVAYHCIFLLGFQSGDDRVLAHSLLGCALYGAFAAKVLVVRLHRFPVWVLPTAGGLLFADADRRLVHERGLVPPPRRRRPLTPTHYATRRGPRASDRPRPRRGHAARAAPARRARARPHAARQARVHEPRRKREGPHRHPDDRGGRARGEAAARRDDRRADEREHGRRPRRSPPRSRATAASSSCPTRSPRRSARSCAPTAPRSSSARRRSPPESPESYYSVSEPAGRGDPRRVQARPVLEPGQPGGALRDDRAGDLGADRRRARRDRLLRRHRRDDLRRRRATCGSGSPTCSSSAPTPRARSTRSPTTSTPTSSRASARTSGRRPTTRRSSTST